MARRSAGLVKLIGLCLTAGVLVAAVLFPVVGSIGLVSNRAADTVDQTSGDLAKGELPLVTTVQDKDGNAIAYLFNQYRIPTPSDQIAKSMKAAIVAIEDRRFYEHNGVDWQGILRAAAKAGSGGDTQGASTLDQQYVKNYLAFVLGKGDKDAYEKATEQTVARKLKEARIALQLEQRLRAEGKDAKEVILTDYLNVVPYGNRTFGIGAAARTYFNTTPDQLTVPQAALLAAVVNAPSTLNPGTAPDDALKRRNIVIDRMRDTGALGPDKAAAEKAATEYKAAPLGVVSPLNTVSNGCVISEGDGPANGFFCSYLIDYLAKAGLSLDQLKTGGYTIKTTLDQAATRAAKQAAEQQVPKTTDGIANVMSVVQPGQDSHKVRALVSSRDFGNDLNAGQTAYPLPSEVTKFGAGSIYKVFTAAAAMERGLTGIDKTIKTPGNYCSTVFKDGRKPYCVKNAGTYGEEMTLTQALATSPNTGFLGLEDQIGSVAPVVDMAYKLGMRETMQGVNDDGDPLKADKSNGPSLGDATKNENRGSFTLGAGATSVLELANVSATLMSGGKWCPPTPVEQVLDRNGQPVQLKEPACEQVVPKELAYSLVQGMSQDDKGTGTSAGAARNSSWDRPILGKTGTTETSKSTAFMGATPQYAGAVMILSDSPNPENICGGNGRPLYLCGNSANGIGGIYGGTAAAPTWFNAMKVIHQNLPVEQLPPADPKYR
ncbi:transglycosylase domain-containing protein [Solihabitans fulvus]|uniref:transglycosylase domain-containing protein n=1 Tax=Solihabitans fulvus TaxID=1892852 RepID=UPI001CB760DE|nr:transglycosylase domain-containing protein [Solihabitans fulvus]